MPPWEIGDLADAPRLTLKSWALLLGPGLVMGGAAIGGGEWLAGPLTTARYGGAVLWLATVSILAQVLYNLEISRYTLYCGEPIFTGKFRLVPGPVFWLVLYLFLDFGSVFPYLVANAATPLAAVGPRFGQFFWLMTLFCGFLVLAPSAATTADGVLRRWVDVCWTAIPALRRLPEHGISYVYFAALCCYATFGVISLTWWNPVELLKWATNIYNAALGFSCFHVLAVNTILLPRPLRPNYFIRLGLILGGLFFTALSILSTLKLLGRV
jgi:hypothetical protein